MIEKKFKESDPPDRLNPEFLYNTVDSELLLKIATGEIDPVKLAKRAMANRGLNKHGNWCGFNKAREIWGVK